MKLPMTGYFLSFNYSDDLSPPFLLLYKLRRFTMHCREIWFAFILVFIFVRLFVPRHLCALAFCFVTLKSISNPSLFFYWKGNCISRMVENSTVNSFLMKWSMNALGWQRSPSKISPLGDYCSKGTLAVAHLYLLIKRLGITKNSQMFKTGSSHKLLCF